MYSKKNKCKILIKFKKDFLFLEVLVDGWVKRVKIIKFEQKKRLAISCKSFVRWAMTGSNRRHFGCKPNALPAELIALTFITI